MKITGKRPDWRPYQLEQRIRIGKEANVSFGERATRVAKTLFTRLGNKKKGQMLRVVDAKEKSHVVYKSPDLKYDRL